MDATLPAIDALESVGVDYLTATAYRNGDGRSFRDLGQHLLEQSALAGNDLRPYRERDYRGYQAGGVICGTRYDTHLIRLSSDEARDNWKEVYRRSTNVSRVDLQLTMRLAREYEPYIREQHAQAVSAKQGRGRRREVELRWNNVKGDTLYLGSRTSDVFARVYDKGRQEGWASPGLLIRQEIEYKRKVAKGVAEQLIQMESERIGIARFVSTYISRFGLQTTASEELNVQYARGRTTSIDAKRAWLHNAVRPSVARLVDAGMLREALDALGLSELVTINSELERED